MSTTTTTTPTPTPTPPSSFPVGSRVILKNLTKGTEFNGKVGIVKSPLDAATNSRQQILLLPSGKMLGIKPINLDYEPRTINSLSVGELKSLLTAKGFTQFTGLDKSQLREMAKIKMESTTESEQEIAHVLYTQLEKEQQEKAAAAAATTTTTTANRHTQDQATMLGNMTPNQLRQQARMLRSMPPSQIRRMNPQMAGFSDAEIQMAANQMEMMANNPSMLKQMTDQMKNMSPEELEQVKRMQANSGAAPSGMGAGYGAGSMPQNMADMNPEQLKQQAQMMKSMEKNTLRSMNPAMAKWSDAQIDMAIAQMETMAENPEMMKQVSEQMKSMKPEEIEKMRELAASGGLDAATATAGAGAGGTGGAANGMSTNPMDMLNKTDPAQIKQMLKMMKENPKLMKDMLRSSNPAMADNMSDEQIQKTIDAFANMDEKKIGLFLKVLGWVQEFRNSTKAKVVVFLLCCMFVFVIGMLVYLVKSQKGMDGGGNASDTTVGVGENDIPPVPIMDSEF